MPDFFTENFQTEYNMLDFFTEWRNFCKEHNEHSIDAFDRIPAAEAIMMLLDETKSTIGSKR